MRIEVRGTVYESVSEAAKALRVSRVTLHAANLRGRLDFVGLGRGKTTAPEVRAQARATPVTVGGETWASKAELSRWLGRNEQYVSTVMRRGEHERLLGEVMRRRAQIEAQERQELADLFCKGGPR